MDNANQDLGKTLQLLRDGLHNTIQSFRVFRVEQKVTTPFQQGKESQQERESTSLPEQPEQQLVNLNESYFENPAPSQDNNSINLLAPKAVNSDNSSEKLIENKDDGKLNPIHDVVSEAVTKREKRKNSLSLRILKEGNSDCTSEHQSERNILFIDEDSKNGSSESPSKSSMLESISMSNLQSAEGFLSMQDINSATKPEMDLMRKYNIEYDNAEESDQSEPEDNIINSRTYFKDGVKKVDYILVYNKKYTAKMEVYLYNIHNDGLDLEMEQSKIDKELIFVKIHAPKVFLKNMEVRLPIRWSFRYPYYFEEKSSNLITNTILTRRNNGSINDRAPQLVHITKVTDAERIMAIHKLLAETKFGKYLHDFGLERMIESKIMVCAFPMHDKMWEWNNVGILSDRQLLGKYWANFYCLFKVQPTQLINKYFGNEIAFYFAWLGFYTKMLLPIVILGLIVLLYGLCTANVTWMNEQSYEISKSDIFLCPICGKTCYFSFLRDSYQISKLSYLVDNAATTIFNILMSFWGVTFLIFWKQKERFYKIVWNLSELNEVAVTKRSKFYVTKRRKGFTTLTDVDKYKRRQSNWWYLFSTVIMILSIVTIFNIIFGSLLLKMDLVQLLNDSSTIIDGLISKIGSNILRVEITWSTITIIFIMIIDSVTPFITYSLTRWENPKTELQFDNSYILKLFALTFITNYSIPIYLAFFKGSFYIPPNNLASSIFWNLAEDVCDASGCMVSLSCWITTAVIIKLAKTLLVDFVAPRIITSFRNLTPIYNFPSEWEKNYTLLPYRKTKLIQLYIESIILYGFVVCFVTASPLIPFLVWITNVIKIRIHAINLIRYEKRPNPTVKADLGIWNKILKTVTLIGILIHILVIAFTTELIPKFLFFPENLRFQHYIESKLTVLLRDFHYARTEPLQFCRFMGYRNGSSLAHAPIYYKIIGGKLIFTLIMEHLVIIFLIIFTYYVPVLSKSMKKYINQVKQP